MKEPKDCQSPNKENNIDETSVKSPSEGPFSPNHSLLEFQLSPLSTHSCTDKSTDDCFTPVMLSQKSVFPLSQDSIPIHRYHEQLRQLTFSLFSEDSAPSTNTSSSVANEKATENKSTLPSKKELAAGIYRKLCLYLDEEIKLRQSLILEKKTPAKVDSSRIVMCPPIKRIKRTGSCKVYDSDEDN